MKNSLFKQTAAERLSAAGGVLRRLSLIYSGSLAGVSLISSLVSFYLSNMESEGGLSTLGTQAVLTTATVVLRFLPLLLLPIWTAGLHFAALKLLRAQEVSDADLPEGFRRIGSLLGTGVFLLAQYTMVYFVSSYLGSQIFLCTPYAKPWMEAVFHGKELAITELSFQAQLVYYGIVAVVFVFLAAPVFYRYRLITHWIMDGANPLQALPLTSIMTRRRRLQLLRLDLSYWWFWAGIGVTVIAGNASVFFVLPNPILGWLLPILAALAQILLCTLALPKLLLTYASCYDTFRQAPAPKPERPAAPVKHPWEGWQA